MNILTFDIEEWSLEKDYFGNHKEKYAEFDRILNHILDNLSERSITATFFCLGKIAIDFPYVVKKIASEGHEIGSHSHAHKWVNKMTPDEFREDTHAAVASIEDLIGKKVVSFRAPAFSIGESNKWAFEILAENGIENDASIFPGVRDFGGFPNFTEQQPCIIEYNGILINEFPIRLYSLPILHKQLAYSGGGYFRLIPLWLVMRQLENVNYNMCYFHIDDLLTEKTKLMSKSMFEEYFKEPGTIKNRYIRYFKSNIGRANALSHLDALLKLFPFCSIQSYLKSNKLNQHIEL